MLSGHSDQPRQTLEVDFVANQGHHRYYIQSTCQIPDDRKREQELRPLLKSMLPSVKSWSPSMDCSIIILKRDS